MSYRITIQPSGNSFEMTEDDTVLHAALNEGFHLPYGCRNGACGSCKGKLLQGEMDYGTYQSSALSDEERAAGFALFCVGRPRSDLVIESREIGAVKDIVVKKLPCRVQKVDKITDDVAVLHLSLPANERLQFLPGQYIEFILKDGTRKSFSMANAPHDDASVQVHVRHVPGGKFTDHVFNTMKEREIMRFEGPLGSFFLREDSDKPIVFEGVSETGKAISSADYLGRVLVVNFWAGYCAPCRVEAPMLEKLSTDWASKGASFVGVNTYDEPATAQAFARTYGVTYPSLIDADSGAAQLAFAGNVPPSALPTTIVLDSKGRVAARILGALEAASILDAIIKTVIAEDG